ncbi:hypothetical protein [Mesorhizobium sp. B2-4-17]|uniref:hypothetical protein n=2 Tax=Mesorhizobium TaxID=68287 RepID=UPI00112C7872|nr:hypothetical protein [Mesorhizobium sp. B2-4-17]TPK83469.1 hypothetical protein FJ548_18780 [Mesorhizobium sp. B2-4-17]
MSERIMVKCGRACEQKRNIYSPSAETVRSIFDDCSGGEGRKRKLLINKLLNFRKFDALRPTTLDRSRKLPGRFRRRLGMWFIGYDGDRLDLARLVQGHFENGFDAIVDGGNGQDQAAADLVDVDSFMGLRKPNTQPEVRSSEVASSSPREGRR